MPPWKPGQSGNPNGRPKLSPEIRELAQTHGPEAIAKIVSLMQRGKTQAIQLAAATALLDRGYGRPPQAVTDPNGDPLGVGAVREAAPLLLPQERAKGLAILIAKLQALPKPSDG